MSEQTINQDQILQNLSNQASWIRLLYMLVYGVMLHLAGLVMWLLCTVQFVCALIFGQDNRNLRSLAATLIEFIQQALQFVSYNSEDKPFPFAGSAFAGNSGRTRGAQADAGDARNQVIDVAPEPEAPEDTPKPPSDA